MGRVNIGRARLRARVAVLAVATLGATVTLAAPAEAAPVPAPTSTQLTVDHTTAIVADPVVLTATVAGPGDPAAAPDGVVVFRRGTTSLGTAPATHGTATLTTTAIPVGTWPITATYVKTNAFASSASPATEVTVAKGSSATVLSLTPKSALPGDLMTFSATVSGPDAGHPAAGSVTFKRGPAAIGTATIAGGLATLVRSLPAGSTPVTATYNGSASLGGSVSAPIAIDVAKAATATSLTVDSGSAGTLASLEATVLVPGIDRTPAGTVTFRRGSSAIATVPLTGEGTAHLGTALPAGSLSITATYNGSTGLLPSTSPASLVSVTKAETATALVVDPGTSAPTDDPVTLTASVTVPEDGRIPTGTVTFRRGTIAIASPVPLDATGRASVATSSLPAASYGLTATYNGSSTLTGSSSTSSAFAVYKPITVTSLALGAPTAVAGEPVALTATVVVPGTTRVPAGSVTFRKGTTAIETVPLDASGTATSTKGVFAPGAVALTATYNGTTKLQPSTSSGASLLVGKAATAIDLDPFMVPSAAGEPVTLTARVRAQAPSIGTPTGQVSFASGGSNLGRAPLVDGVATLTTTALPPGPSTISVTYAGSGSYLPSDESVSSALGAPTDVVAEAGRASALVSFAGPLADGGSPIVSFTVTAVDLDDADGVPQTTEGWSSPIEVTGLDPGHAYTFTVTATNEGGSTATSAASEPVTPLAPCPAVDGTSERAAARPGVDWHGCNLTGADLSGLDLAGADLDAAALRNANLTGADVSDVSFSSTDLAGADLAGATIDGATFGTSMHRVRSGGLVGTPAAVASSWRLTHGYLVGPGAQLEGADLAGADLTGLHLGDVDLSGADLTGANLASIVAGFADLEEADFTDADLTGAIAIVSNIKGATFHGAKLTGASLGASDLTGSDLTDADLTGASFAGGCAPGGFPCFPNATLTGVVYCNTKMPDGTIGNGGCTP